MTHNKRRTEGECSTSGRGSMEAGKADTDSTTAYSTHATTHTHAHAHTRARGRACALPSAVAALMMIWMSFSMEKADTYPPARRTRVRASAKATTASQARRWRRTDERLSLAWHSHPPTDASHKTVQQPPLFYDRAHNTSHKHTLAQSNGRSPRQTRTQTHKRAHQRSVGAAVRRGRDPVAVVRVPAAGRTC